MNSKILTALGIFFFFFLPSSLLADTVRLKGKDSAFHGKIVHQDKEKVWLEVERGVLIFKRGEVDFEYNSRKPEKGYRALSIVSVDDGKKEEGGKTTPDLAKDVGKDLTNTKKESVPSWDMGQIQRWIMELQRSRSKDRQKA